MRISDWSSDVCSSDLGDGDLSFGTTLSYRSKTYQFEIPNPYIDQKGFALWDASIVYTAPDDRWSLGVFGKNLTDKEYKTSGYTFVNFNPVTGAPTSALGPERSEEHTSELQSLMRISYAVFCLKKKN